jgi:hypothetical protein
MIPPMGPVPMTIMRVLMESSSAIQLGQIQDIGSAQFRQSKWFST